MIIRETVSFHHQLSHGWRLFQRKHPPYGSHFAIWTLHRLWKRRCTFIANVITRETVHVSISAVSLVKYFSKTHCKLVNLQFGFCSAVESDVAPLKPIWLFKRLLMSASVTLVNEYCFTKSSRHIIHFAICTLQRKCKWRCTFIANLVTTETCSGQHQFSLERKCSLKNSSLYDSYLAIWTLQCSRKRLCAFVTNLVRRKTVCFMPAASVQSREGYFYFNPLYVSHFALWTLQCTRKWLCTFIANMFARESVSVSAFECLDTERVN